MAKVAETQHYPFLEVARAPDSPGLYAWYGSLALFPADYRDDVVEGVNLGVVRLRESLARHTARFDPRPRRLSGRSEFGARWRGQLQDFGRTTIRGKIIRPAESSSGIDASLHASTSDEYLRGDLVSLLRAAQPTLASPLYIGVTNSLRRRLREHVNLYNELKDAILRDSDHLAALKRSIENERTEFAHRVVAAEFEPENLSVYVWPYASSLSPSKVDSLLRSAEWLLNRWYRPLLGRE
jgi:hypothetical protein